MTDPKTPAVEPRGFNECADIAEQALARLAPKNPVRLVEGGEK